MWYFFKFYFQCSFRSFGTTAYLQTAVSDRVDKAFNRSGATQAVPLDGTHLVAVKGLTTKRLSTQERQREELVGASLLRPIRTNGSSLTCRCQFPDSR